MTTTTEAVTSTRKGNVGISTVTKPARKTRLRPSMSASRPAGIKTAVQSTV